MIKRVGHYYARWMGNLAHHPQSDINLYLEKFGIHLRTIIKIRFQSKKLQNQIIEAIQLSKQDKFDHFNSFKCDF